MTATKQPAANQLTPYEAKLLQFKRDVRAMLPKIAAAVPEHVRPTQLIRTLFNAIEANPKLLEECSSSSIGKCLVQAATYGLEIANGQLGHCYMVPYGQGQNKEKAAQLQLSYKGIKELVRRSGEGMLFMDEVREGDEFENRGGEEKPRHVKSDDQDRHLKQLTHAYAYVKLKSGFVVSRVMTRNACLSHREQYSKTWQNAVRYKKEKQESWHEDNPAFPKMCMKTCVHGLANDGDLPMSADLRQAFNDIEGEAPPADTVLDVVSPPAIEQEAATKEPVAQVDWRYVEDRLNKITTERPLDEFRDEMIAEFPEEKQKLWDRAEEHRELILENK